jgi:fructose-1-phosphate kinase PfkB-like protein
MITDAAIRAVGAVLDWMLGVLPTATMPVEVVGSGDGTVAGFLSSIATTAASFSVWLPLGALVSALTFVLTAVLVAVTLKLARIVASFLTAGGGSAA